MKSFLSVLVVLTVVVLSIINLEKRIYNPVFEHYSIFTENIRHLNLIKSKGSGFNAYKYSLDGYDSPSKVITNSLGKTVLIGYFENSSIPIVGIFEKDQTQIVAGVSLNDTSICLNFNNHEVSSCVPKEGTLPIPVVFDSDHDGVDEISFYYFDSGKWLLYDLTANFTLKLVKTYEFPSEGYPIFLKRINGDKIGIWIEDEVPYFYFQEVNNITSSKEIFQFGIKGDIPFSFDLKCDGNEIVGVYRRANTTWYFRDSENENSVKQWGTLNGVPLIGKFDEDNCSDTAIYDKGSDFTVAILPAFFSNESLKIFPNGNAVISKIKLEKLDRKPHQIWNYHLYRTYRLKKLN